MTPITVEQVDRDAAAELSKKLFQLTGTMLVGDAVADAFYTAFARHRLNTRTQSEGVREIDGTALDILCLDFVREQSAGEWGDKVEREDANKLIAFVRSLGRLSPVPQEEK